MIPIVAVVMPGVMCAPVIIIIMVVVPSLIVDDHDAYSPAVDVRVTAGVKKGQTGYQNEVKTKNNIFHLNPP